MIHSNGWHTILQKISDQGPVYGKQTISLRYFFRSLKSISKNCGVLFMHGWISYKTGYLSRDTILSELGFTRVIFNLRAEGESDRSLQRF